VHAVFDSYASPLVRRRQGSAAALSVGVHAAIAMLLLWRGAVVFENSAGTEDRRQPAMSWVVLPEVNSQEGVPVPTVAAPSHKLSKSDVPPIVATAPRLSPPDRLRPSLHASLPRPLPSAVSLGDELSAGFGRGPSCGGSREVVASADAVADTIAEPPDDSREHFVQFWIRTDGRVARIVVRPPIRDSHYRRRFMAALDTFVFGGVKTPDGRPIDYIYSCFVDS
jgi:hypothetical protein